MRALAAETDTGPDRRSELVERIVRPARAQTAYLTNYLQDFTAGACLKKFRGSDGVNPVETFLRTCTLTNSQGTILLDSTDAYAAATPYADHGYYAIQGTNLLNYGNTDPNDTYFNPAGVPVMPLQMVIGQTYTFVNVTYSGSDTDGSYTVTETDTVRAVGFETVTVLAGTFTNALRIESIVVQNYDYTGTPYGPVKHYETNWLVAGLGEVKSTFTDVYPDLSTDYWTEDLAEFVILSTLPMNQIVPVGGAAALAVTTVSSKPVTYQWQQASNAVTGATGAVFLKTNLQPSDVGFYTLAVTSPFGTFTNLPVTLSTFGISAQGGQPYLTLNAPPGSSLGLDYVNRFPSTNVWTTLTNFVVGDSPTNFVDTPTNSQRFYRAVQH